MKTTFIHGHDARDFYLIPTVYIYSREKDAYTVEFRWFWGYFGWHRKHYV